MAAPRDIGCEHPDLAVGDLARRAGVLPSHAAGGLALLQEPCLVNHQDGIRFGKRLDHVLAHNIAQRVGIPAAPPQDRLLPPGAGVTRRFGAHPARLAPLLPPGAGGPPPLRRPPTPSCPAPPPAAHQKTAPPRPPPVPA